MLSTSAQITLIRASNTLKRPSTARQAHKTKSKTCKSFSRIPTSTSRIGYISSTKRWSSTDTTEKLGPLPSLETTMDEIKPFLKKMNEQFHFKGLAVALIADDQVAYHSVGTYREGLEPISEERSKDLTFQIGSISKPLTGMALEAMVQDGKINYSTTVHECLPEVNRNSQAGALTMLQLATHSSGLPRLPSDLLTVSKSVDPYSKYSKSHVISNLNKLDSLSPPGTKYEYSNFGYGVLGMAMTEKHSTKKYDAMMEELIFSKLGMHNTSTMARLDTVGYDESLEPVQPWNFDALKACGAIRSTPNDMIKLAQALVNPASSKLEKVITNSIQAFDGPVPMGLGWVIGLGSGKNKDDIFWHNGMAGGYHSFIGVHKPTKRAVLLLANSDSNMISTTGAHFLSTLVGKPSMPKLHDYFDEDIPDELLADYIGVYRHQGQIHFQIKKRGKDIWVKVRDYPWVKAYPENPFKFHIRSLGATIDFDGIVWESRLPPHTITFVQGDFRYEATRDGQEIRKFFVNVSKKVKGLFGSGAKKTQETPESGAKQD